MAATACAVVNVSRSVVSTGNGAALSSEPTAPEGRKPPVRSIPAGTGSVGANDDARVAETTSVRSPGVITRSPSAIWSRKLPAVIAATFTALMSRSRDEELKSVP